MELPRCLSIRLDRQTSKLLEQHAKSRDQYKLSIERILSKKQSEINQQIQKLGRQHLLVLQKKVLLIQKKDEQIVKLTNSVTQLRNSVALLETTNLALTDDNLSMKIQSTLMKKSISQIQAQLKDQKNKCISLKKQLDIKKQQLNQSSESYQKLQRQYLKYKQEMSLNQTRTQSLLKNQENFFKNQYQQQILSIKNQQKTKINHLQAKIKQQKKKNGNLQNSLQNQKQKGQKLQGIIEELKKFIRPALNVTPTLILKYTSYTQTEIQRKQPTKSYKSYSISVNMQCPSCAKNIDVSHEKVKQIIQTFKQYNNDWCQTQSVEINKATERTNGFSQTTIKFVAEQQLFRLLELYQSAKKAWQRKQQIHNDRYTELQNIFLSRPIRSQDIKTINNIQMEKMQLQMNICQLMDEINNLTHTIQQLHKQINYFKSSNSNSMIVSQIHKQQNLLHKQWLNAKPLQFLDKLQSLERFKDYNPFQNLQIRRQSKTFNTQSFISGKRLLTDKQLYLRTPKSQQKIQRVPNYQQNKSSYKKYSIAKRKRFSEFKLITH